MDPFEIFPLEIIYKILEFCTEEWYKLYCKIKSKTDEKDVVRNDINNILHHISPLNRLNNLYKNLPFVSHLWRQIIIDFCRLNSFKKTIRIKNYSLKWNDKYDEKITNHWDFNQRKNLNKNRQYHQELCFNVNSNFIFQSCLNNYHPSPLLSRDNNKFTLRHRNIKIKGELMTYEIDIIYHFRMSKNDIYVFFNIKNIDILNRFVFRTTLETATSSTKLKMCEDICFCDINMQYISSELQKRRDNEIDSIGCFLCLYYQLSYENKLLLADQFLIISGKIFNKLSLEMCNFSFRESEIGTSTFHLLLFAGKNTKESNFGVIIDNIIKGFV